MTGPVPTSLQFSTNALPQENKTEAWRDLFGHTICGLDIEPLKDQPFQSKALLRVLPGLGAAAGKSTGAHYWRPAHRIVSDDLVFVINHEGHDLARMNGREEIIAPGQAVLFAADRVGGNTNAGTSRFTTLRIPKAALPDADRAVLRPVSAGNEALGLLANYLSVLRDPKALATYRQQSEIASHVHALIGMALQLPGDNARAYEAGAIAARTRAIKRDIEANATDPDFTISAVARRHRITPRYVQMLFAKCETTFSDYVKTTRLAAAHRRLAESVNGKSISDIALDVGFSNVSYFNRAFRREFNATPSDVRGGAKRQAEFRNEEA
jgi:AraC-like DNA-binding protein